MPLTARSSGGLISAGDVNDFRNLLTGVMQDQLVTLVNLLQVKSRGASPGALTAGLAAGGSIDVGAHDYAVTFVDAGGGETLAGTHTTLTTTGGNQTGNLTAIPTGPTGTTSRNIYRSKVGTTSPLFLLHTIADNTTTTYTDTATDASLPVTKSPTHPSFGGSTQWLDNTGAVKAQVFSDGAVSLSAGNITTDTAGNITTNGGLFTVGNSTLAGVVTFSGAGTALSVTNNASIGGTLSLTGAVAKVNNISTAGPHGVAVEAQVAKDTVVANTTATSVLTFTTPNDATNHHFLVTAEWFVGGGNTNSGVCTLTVTFTDPHAGSVTLNFFVYGTTSSVGAFTLAKGLVGRCFPRSLNVSPNTTITVTYQNTATGTISDTVSTSLLMLA